MRPLVFLLLLATLAQVQSFKFRWPYEIILGLPEYKPIKTEISYDGTFNCSLTNQMFCFYGRYGEYDLIPHPMDHRPSGETYQIPFHCGMNVVRHAIHFRFTGGDVEPGSRAEYEPYLELYHNCTTSKTVKHMTHYFDTIPVGDKFHNRYYSIQLHNNGSDTFWYTKPMMRFGNLPSGIKRWLYESSEDFHFNPENDPFQYKPTTMTDIEFSRYLVEIIQVVEDVGSGEQVDGSGEVVDGSNTQDEGSGML